MIAEISEQLYSALQPRLVSAYLSSKGWHTTKEGDASHWSHPNYQGDLVIPSGDTITPELVQQLAILEQRSDTRVLTELKHADADLLRIIPIGAGPDTLLLEQSNRLLRGAQRLRWVKNRVKSPPIYAR